MKFTHDTDGKIYVEAGKSASFVFEVEIKDGDEVARRLNSILRASNTEQNKTAVALLQEAEAAHAISTECFCKWHYVNKERLDAVIAQSLPQALTSR